MKVSRDYLKSLVNKCLDEILSEADQPLVTAPQAVPTVIAPDEDPKVKKLRRDVEIKKQSVEREKQKSLNVSLADAKKKRISGGDQTAKKAADAEVKGINDKIAASKAAQNAAVKTASSVK